jgi:opacity protein-like surface antigen
MKSIIIFLIISLNIFAQTKVESYFSIEGKIGLIFPGITSWQFTKDPARILYEKIYTVYPGYYFGLGIESKDLVKIENIGVHFGLDVSYGSSSTDEVEIYYGPAKFELTSLPIMFWATIKSKGTIVPFIKLGIGAQRTQFIETYEANPQFNFDIKDWFFAWGIGGGIDFNFLERIKLSLFIEGIIMESGITTVLPDGRQIYYNSRNGSTYSGIQIGYHF